MLIYHTTMVMCHSFSLGHCHPLPWLAAIMTAPSWRIGQVYDALHSDPMRPHRHPFLLTFPSFSHFSPPRWSPTGDFSLSPAGWPIPLPTPVWHRLGRHLTTGKTLMASWLATELLNKGEPVDGRHKQTTNNVVKLVFFFFTVFTLTVTKRGIIRRRSSSFAKVQLHYSAYVQDYKPFSHHSDAFS